MNVIVIGAGVAGVAAAIAARRNGAAVMVIERSAHVGGVAVSGHHRTLCGLSPIDSATPELIEPEATDWWIPRITTGAPFKRGRVWLWPTSPERLANGLLSALAEQGISLLTAAAPSIQADGTVTVANQRWRPSAVIDASGGACWTGGDSANGQRSAIQWGAWRAELELALPDTAATRRNILRRIAHLSPGIACEYIRTDRWQVSLDTAGDNARALMIEAARLLGSTVVGEVDNVAQRDIGGYDGIGLDELFSCATRGLAWAAWPSEVHDAHGIHWRWPAGDRHGCPPSLVKPLHAPAWLWCCGKGLAAAPESAAALRVVGTALALGHACGTLATTP